MDRTGAGQQTAGECNGKNRVPFWSVAVSYLSRLLMVYVGLLIMADVDSVFDLLSGWSWMFSQFIFLIFVAAVGVPVLLNFVRDCCNRCSAGYWVRSKWGVQKNWRSEILLWGCYILLFVSVVLVNRYFVSGRETIEGITWRYKVLGGNAIIGRGRCRDNRAAISVASAGSLTIPSTLGGRPVTGIGGYAFHRCKRLTSVTIPEGVRWIGAEVFNGCDGLKAVTLPDSLTHIHYEAFRDCHNLASVTIPENIEYIDETAFVGTPFLDNAPDGLVVFSGIAYRWKGECPEEVKIAEGVTRIFDKAFERRGRLKSVTIGNSVTNVGAAAFHGCGGLTSVTLGNRVASIGDRAFYACFNLSAVSIPKSLSSIGKDAFRGSRIEKIYVEKGDAERIKELLRGKGIDLDKVEFVEHDDESAVSFVDNPANGQAK